MYIVVRGAIFVKGTDNANKKYKNLIFKNDAPFRLCILKINNTFVDNVENLDNVMPMFNF